MKRTLLAAILFFVAVPAYAATFHLEPATGRVSVGEDISVAVFVNTQDEKIVTAKLALQYPENLLEFVSFTPSAQWMPLSASGYDSARIGSIVKTSGFPGGFTGEKKFGEIILRAKNAGSAEVSILADNSLLLNAQGVNKLNEISGAVVTITSAVPAEVMKKSTGTLVEPFEELKSRGELPTTSKLIATSSEQGAAVSQSFLASLGLRGWLIIILVIGIVAAVAWRVAVSGKEERY
jgi:hypothetical protein